MSVTFDEKMDVNVSSELNYLVKLYNDISGDIHCQYRYNNTFYIKGLNVYNIIVINVDIKNNIKYYYKIKRLNNVGQCWFGYSNKYYNPNINEISHHKMPLGFDKNSWGLNLMNGYVSYNHKYKKYFNPKNNDINDVYGCHIDIDKQIICYSKNDIYLDNAFNGMNIDNSGIKPTICVSQGCEIEIILDNSFDINYNDYMLNYNTQLMKGNKNRINLDKKHLEWINYENEIQYHSKYFNENKDNNLDNDMNKEWINNNYHESMNDEGNCNDFDKCIILKKVLFILNNIDLNNCDNSDILVNTINGLYKYSVNILFSNIIHVKLYHKNTKYILRECSINNKIYQHKLKNDYILNLLCSTHSLLCHKHINKHESKTQNNISKLGSKFRSNIIRMDDEKRDNTTSHTKIINFEAKYSKKDCVKYSSFKKEILCNKYHKITNIEWIYEIKKAIIMSSNKYIMNKLKAKDRGSINIDYNICTNQMISLSHLICISLYVNNTKLQYQFKLNGFQGNSSNNQEIGNWSRLLFESVTFFGEQTKENDTFYHIISNKVALNQLNPIINTPLSVSINKEQITHLASKTDIVLKVKQSTMASNYINVDYISDYYFERERIFFGINNLSIVNIYTFNNKGCMISNRKYIEGISLYMNIINGKYITSCPFSAQCGLVSLINQLHSKSNNNSNNNNNQYILKMFTNILVNNKIFYINKHTLRAVYNKLKVLIFHRLPTIPSLNIKYIYLPQCYYSLNGESYKKLIKSNKCIYSDMIFEHNICDSEIKFKIVFKKSHKTQGKYFHFGIHIISLPVCVASVKFGCEIYCKQANKVLSTPKTSASNDSIIFYPLFLNTLLSQHESLSFHFCIKVHKITFIKVESIPNNLDCFNNSYCIDFIHSIKIIDYKILDYKHCFYKMEINYSNIDTKLHIFVRYSEILSLYKAINIKEVNHLFPSTKLFVSSVNFNTIKRRTTQMNKYFAQLFHYFATNNFQQNNAIRNFIDKQTIYLNINDNAINTIDSSSNTTDNESKNDIKNENSDISTFHLTLEQQISMNTTNDNELKMNTTNNPINTTNNDNTNMDIITNIDIRATNTQQNIPLSIEYRNDDQNNQSSNIEYKSNDINQNDSNNNDPIKDPFYMPFDL